MAEPAKALADTISSPAFIARCMRDGAAELRKRANKIESAIRGYERRGAYEQADLMRQKARAMYEAARQIDIAADAYARATEETDRG